MARGAAEKVGVLSIVRPAGMSSIPAGRGHWKQKRHRLRDASKNPCMGEGLFVVACIVPAAGHQQHLA
jgi:hypothetical protein